MLNVMRSIVEVDDFQERLDATRDRIDAIESLHRTRELQVKDRLDMDEPGVLRILLADRPSPSAPPPTSRV